MTGLIRRCLSATIWILVLALSALAFACNVPVFRFALERWRPDAYRVTLLHRGPLTETQRELIQPLEEAQDKALVNVTLHAVDVNELEKPAADDQAPLAGLRDRVWSQLGAGEALLVVQYPEHLRIDIPVWTGPLGPETIAQLVASPVRHELVNRLASGQTAVWLLLESGQTERDNAAAELLEAELQGLQRTLKLPELTSDPDDELLASTPFKVAFSVLRVPHGAAAEEALIGMLLRCESDLVDRSDPLVFPVFARGRALLPLVGAGITAKNIQEASTFLVGPCSCQVKEQNPGFDLLLSADWDSLLSLGGQRLAVVQTRGTATDGEAVLVPIPSGSRPDELVIDVSPTAPGPTNNTSWLVPAGILAGAAAFVFLLSAMHAGKS